MYRDRITARNGNEGRVGCTRSAAWGRRVHGGCAPPQRDAVVQPVDRITGYHGVVSPTRWRDYHRECRKVQELVLHATLGRPKDELLEACHVVSKINSSFREIHNAYNFLSDLKV